MIYPYHQIVILIVIVSLSATIYLSNYSLLSEFKSRISRLKHGTLELKQRNQCTMETCFNLTRCQQNGFKIFIYSEPKHILSKIYSNIIEYLNKSEFVTDDPNRACLFVLALDTLDRDRLSSHFVRNLDQEISKLAFWNNGENHIVFNLYSGSWPDYIENELEMNTSKAILAKASFSVNSYRVGFDLSFPLFHAELPFNDSNAFMRTNSFGNSHLAKKYFLTFKGKRYLSGVGSETRNALYHLHNNRDIILLTTCKHGYNWEELKDERCDVDNEAYDKYDYTDLIERSIFCLVPRGRRLGTYRFLEALKSGCVPVLLSNGWVLPFTELLDWQRVVIWADERRLSTLIPRLRSIPLERVSQMSALGAQYYSQYFSSIERILQTSLSILQNRIFTTPIHSLTAYSNPTNIQLATHQCQLVLFSLNSSIDPSEITTILDNYKFIRHVFLVNDSNTLNLQELDNLDCVIIMHYGWLKIATDESGFRKGFRIWQDNKMSLVGFNGLSYSFQNGDCYRMNSNLSKGYSFIGLEFIFLPKSYLDLAFDLTVNCSNKFIECLTSVINLLAFKTMKTNSTILINVEKKFSTFNYSSICLDQFFEDIFNLNRTLFKNTILNKMQYFI